MSEVPLHEYVSTTPCDAVSCVMIDTPTDTHPQSREFFLKQTRDSFPQQSRDSLFARGRQVPSPWTIDEARHTCIHVKRHSYLADAWLQGYLTHKKKQPPRNLP